MAARFGFAEDTIRLAAALRPALQARGVPEHVYVDYADPRIMPTSGAKVPAQQGRAGRKVSA